MQNNDFQNLNNEDEIENKYNEKANEEQISEETEEEIIYNNCMDDDDEEFMEEEEESNSPKDDNLKEENKEMPPNQEENLHLIQEEKYEEEPKNIKNIKQASKKINLNLEENKNNQLNQNKSQKNKFQAYYSPKFDFARKKHKKAKEVKNSDELFTKAIEKTKIKNESNKEYDQEGNTFSTKVTDILYDKYIGQNGRKEKNIDVISKMKDEEIRVKQQSLRTKDDAKKINDMLSRQEDFEKVKINKLKEREKEKNDKINQECVFMPNGIISSSRTPDDFYDSQLKFIEKKEDNINQIYKDIIDKENKKMNVILTSKESEKIASAKNPNETREAFLKRLYQEKLKNQKAILPKPKKEKKMTKEQVNDLSNKLYKEGQTFRENKDKKQKEKILKDMNNNREDFISEKSIKVLLDKFISNYEKILSELFNKNNNFQISLDEYKLILHNMGCINPNSHIDDELIKESFTKYLKPNEDKIDTYAFLTFGLAALGIYKGNDEIKKQKKNFDIKEDKNSRRKNYVRPFNKTSSEIIKMRLPNLDLDKYGYTNKITRIIRQKFFSLVKELNGAWIGENSKKKQERKEKLEEAQKKEEMKKTNIVKKEIRKEYNNNENKKDSNLEENKNNIGKSSKLEDVYKIIQQKKENDLKTLKAKKEAEELALCTFHPNINKQKNDKNIDKNQIKKNIEKLYQEGKAAYIQKKKFVSPDPEDNDENKINCTFRPVINQYNNEMFSKNPLKEDMQKIEKIREQRINKSHKGFERPMNFSIESKINKEDIIDRVIPDRKTKNEATLDENVKGEIAPLLKVEVNLDEKNNTDKIIIYPGDNVKEKTIQFCLKHKLNEEKKKTLLKIILEKMKENSENEDREIDENNNDEKGDNRKEEKKNIGNEENQNIEKKDENKDNKLENNNEEEELYEDVLTE